MDPVTLIVAALAAGAAAGLKDAASNAVHDAYSSLKALVSRRLRGRPDGEFALARHQQAPETWRDPLTAELTTARAGEDLQLVEAASALLELVDPSGARAGKYTLDLHGAQGVQVGEHNTQHNSFGGAPPPLTG